MRLPFNLSVEDEFKIVSSITEIHSIGLGPSVSDVFYDAEKSGKEVNHQSTVFCVLQM
jgi:hypothetical protein